MESVLNNATPSYQMLRPYFQEKSPVDKVLYWCGEEVKPVDRLSVGGARVSPLYTLWAPPPPSSMSRFHC